MLADAHPERARQLAADAEYAAEKISSPLARTWALAEVAGRLAEAGLWDGAEHAARVLNGPRKAQALTQVATRLAASDPERAAHLTAEAERAARAIAEPVDRARVLSDIAAALAASHPEQAQRLAVDAERAAEAISEPWKHALILTEIAAALAGGHAEHARRLAAGAEHAVAGITDPSAQTWALADLAGMLAVAGLQDRAEHAADAITDSKVRARALWSMARALTTAGQWDRAERAAYAITVPENRAKALADIARGLADSNPERAEQITADALDAAHAVVNPWQQARALSRIASALAAAGQWSRAQRTADEISDPENRAEALTGVASILLASVPTRVIRQDQELYARLHRLLGVALTTEYWHATLRVLGTVATEVLIALYNWMAVTQSTTEPRGS